MLDTSSFYKIGDGDTGQTVADGLQSNFEKTAQAIQGNETAIQANTEAIEQNTKAIQANTEAIEKIDLSNITGDMTITGKVSATGGFFETSDKRLKYFGDSVIVDFDKLSKLSKKYFAFKTNPQDTHIGVSAQEIKEIYPAIVRENEQGYLTVDYSKLSVIALAAIDILHTRMKNVEDAINKLTKNNE